MDSDFSAKEALQPVLKVLLSPDGEVIRTLVIKEAVRVSEAFTLSSISDSYKSVPGFMRTLVFNGNANGPLMMSESEMLSMIELRNQVSRIWGLLQSSNDFDPALVLPIFRVLQQPEARRLGGGVMDGITQRLVARFLQQVLRVPATAST